MASPIVYRYLVVEYIEQEQQLVAVIPHNWMCGARNASWPPYKDTKRIMNAAKIGEVPGDEWKTYAVQRIMYQTASWQKARNKCREAGFTSDLETFPELSDEIGDDEPRQSKRRIRSPLRFDDSTDDDDLEVSMLPALPVPSPQLTEMSICTARSNAPVGTMLEHKLRLTSTGTPISTKYAVSNTERARTRDGDDSGNILQLVRGLLGNTRKEQESIHKEQEALCKEQSAQRTENETAHTLQLVQRLLGGTCKEQRAQRTENETAYGTVLQQVLRLLGDTHKEQESICKEQSAQRTENETAHGTVLQQVLHLLGNIHKEQESICKEQRAQRTENETAHERLFKLLEGVNQSLLSVQVFVRKSLGPVIINADQPDDEEFGLPLSSIEEIRKLNSKLMLDRELKKRLVTLLRTYGGNTCEEITRRIMKNLVSHEVSLHFNMTGVKGKTSFSEFSTLMKAIISAVRENCYLPVENKTEKKVEKAIAEWFRHARDRNGGRSRRGKRTAVGPRVTELGPARHKVFLRLKEVPMKKPYSRLQTQLNSTR